MDDTPAHILTDLSPLALRLAVADNLILYLKTLLRSQAALGEEGEGWCTWQVPGVPYPWFNGAWFGTGISPQAAGQLARRVRADFTARGVDTVTCWLDPALDQEAFIPELQAAGFQFSQDTPGMALALANLPQAPQVPAGLQIVQVEQAEGLRTWTETFVAGYGLPGSWGAPLLAMITALGLALPFRYYLGLLDGQPVAVSNLFLGAGVAGVYCVATLPSARRQGLGAALTLAPLFTARALGFQAGILQSSRLGYPVYQRLGFMHLGSVNHFTT